MTVAALRLTAAQREQLSDCRLLLSAAEHDVQLVVRGASPDADQALDQAIELADQALNALRRVRDATGRSGSAN